MKKFVMLVGIPGSGKSTIGKDFTIGETKIYSSDEYRKQLFGDESSQENNGKVFECLYNDIEEEISNYETIILDATNVTKKARRRALDVINKIQKDQDIKIFKHALVINTPLEECIKRDLNRTERVVGEKVIRKFATAFEFPTDSEGFDLITIINCCSIPMYTPFYIEVDKCMEIVPQYVKMKGFNQNNPHHSLTLDQHCIKVAELAYMNNECKEMQLAGLLHDIGKLDTQTTDSEGISHYYQHENFSVVRSMGIVEVLSNKYSLDRDLVLFLIQNHMRIRNIKLEKTIKKYKEMWGAQKYEMLVRFQHYDELATR